MASPEENQEDQFLHSDVSDKAAISEQLPAATKAWEHLVEEEEEEEQEEEGEDDDEVSNT